MNSPPIALQQFRRLAENALAIFRQRRPKRTESSMRGLYRRIDVVHGSGRRFGQHGIIQWIPGLKIFSAPWRDVPAVDPMIDRAIVSCCR